MTYSGEVSKDELDTMDISGDSKSLLINLVYEKTKDRIDYVECLLDDLGDYVIAYYFRYLKYSKQKIVIQSF